MGTKKHTHSPEQLFHDPAEHDLGARLLMGDKAKWVRCVTCGATGYWGGYGMRRRVRWGYGSEAFSERAERWNAWVAERPTNPADASAEGGRS